METSQESSKKSQSKGKKEEYVWLKGMALHVASNVLAGAALALGTAIVHGGIGMIGRSGGNEVAEGNNVVPLTKRTSNG